MSVRDKIIQLVNQENFLGVPITEETSLYQDLHLDSLAFVSLLVGIEEEFGITIELPKMEECLLVGRLVDLVEAEIQGGKS